MGQGRGCGVRYGGVGMVWVRGHTQGWVAGFGGRVWLQGWVAVWLQGLVYTPLLVQVLCESQLHTLSTLE